MDLVPPVGYAPRGAEHLQLPLQQRKIASARHPAAWPGSAACPGQPPAHEFPIRSDCLSVSVSN